MNRTLRIAPEIPFADITNFVPWSIKRTSAGVCSDPVNFLHVPHKWRRLCFFTMILRGTTLSTFYMFIDMLNPNKDATNITSYIVFQL